MVVVAVAAIVAVVASRGSVAVTPEVNLPLPLVKDNLAVEVGKILLARSSEDTEEYVPVGSVLLILSRVSFDIGMKA